MDFNSLSTISVNTQRRELKEKKIDCLLRERKILWYTSIRQSRLYGKESLRYLPLPPTCGAFKALIEIVSVSISFRCYFSVLSFIIFNGSKVNISNTIHCSKTNIYTNNFAAQRTHRSQYSQFGTQTFLHLTFLQLAKLNLIFNRVSCFQIY